MLNRTRQVAGANVPTWGAHWCQLVNMTEQSVCGSDAVLHQITLNTCLDMNSSHTPRVCNFCEIIHFNDS